MHTGLEVSLLHNHHLEYPGTGFALATSSPLSKGCCVRNPFHLALGKVGSSLCKGWPQKRKQPPSLYENDTVKTPSSIIIEMVKTNQIAKQLSLN